MKMIEKVARSIFASGGMIYTDDERTFTTDQYDKLNESERAKYVSMAKAALQAMREPTTRMKAAGQWFQFEDPRHGTPPVNDCVKAGLNASRIWQEMVDAALSEETA